MGLSVQGLADTADLDRSNLSNIENGKVEISLCTNLHHSRNRDKTGTFIVDTRGKWVIIRLRVI
jgi:hypothetical protein